MAKYVIYTRVSTKEQGNYGISLAAQLDRCREYARKTGGEIKAEFSDIETGFSRTRQGLIEALAMAKINDAILMFATYDRLSRDAEYALTVRNSGVELLFLDAPNMSTFEFGVRAVLAQEERELNRRRTKAGLDHCKKKIEEDGVYLAKSGRFVTKLGNPDPTHALEMARIASAKKRRYDMVNDPAWLMARKMAESLQKAGMSYKEILKHFDEFGVVTRTGKKWSKGSLSRMLSTNI